MEKNTRKAKPQDLSFSEDCGAWVIYDHHGQKVARVFDEEQAKLLVDCYNLSSFLYR